MRERKREKQREREGGREGRRELILTSELTETMRFKGTGAMI